MCKYLESFNPVWRTDLVSAGLAMPRYLLRWKTKQKKKRNNILVPCVCTEKTQTETDANRRMLPGLAPCKPEFTQSDPTLTHDHWLGICCDPPGSQGFSNSGQGQFRRGHVVFSTPRCAQSKPFSCSWHVFTSFSVFVQRFNKRKLGLGVRTSARGKLSLLARRKPVNSGGL